MLKITRVNLEKKLYTEGKNLDFYAMAITPWHLLGVKAFVKKLCSEKDTVRGILFIKFHGQAGFIIKEEDLIFPENAEIEILFEERETKSAKGKADVLRELLTAKIGKKDDTHILYILKPFIPDYELGVKYLINSDDNCQLVCIDEGIGTYRSATELFLANWRRNKKAGLIYAGLRWLDSRLKKRMKTKPQYFTLFKMGKGALLENKEVSRWYKGVLSDSVREKLDVTDRPYALLMTQPFELKEDIESKDSINASYDLVKKALNDAGYDVFIKPHPRETQNVIDDYKARGFEIFGVLGPIEQLIWSLSKKPSFVVGSLSTALITAAVLCDVKAVTTIDLMQGEIHPAYLKTAKEYKLKYGALMEIPKNDEELKRALVLE